MEKRENLFLNPTKEKMKEIREYFGRTVELSRQRLGRSILGEDLDLYKIGEGARKILFVGAHHGSEHITASLLYYFLDKVAGGKGKIFGIDKALYLKTYSIFVLPLLNPDGVTLSVLGAYKNPLSERQKRMAGDEGFLRWQANARGVDLNHNYSEGFVEYKRIEKERGILPGRSLYSGEYPESEPESHSLANLVRTLDFSLVVSLHSQGEEIYYFPKGMGKGSATRSVKKIAERLSGELGYRVCVPKDTALYGGLCDYSGESLGIPSLTLEVGRGENPLPNSEYYRIREAVARALFLMPTWL